MTEYMLHPKERYRRPLAMRMLSSAMGGRTISPSTNMVAFSSCLFCRGELAEPLQWVRLHFFARLLLIPLSGNGGEGFPGRADRGCVHVAPRANDCSHAILRKYWRYGASRYWLR